MFLKSKSKKEKTFSVNLYSYPSMIYAAALLLGLELTIIPAQAAENLLCIGLVDYGWKRVRAGCGPKLVK